MLHAAKVKLEQLRPRALAASHPRHEQADSPQSWMHSAAAAWTEEMTPSLSASPCQPLPSASLQIQTAGRGDNCAAPPSSTAMKQGPFWGIAEEDFTLCVVCMDAAPQVRFQPCAHAVTCKLCASKILVQTGECPMCRCQLSALDLLTRNS